MLFTLNSLFQFLIGSLETFNDFLEEFKKYKFQFLIGSLETYNHPIVKEGSLIVSIPYR